MIEAKYREKAAAAADALRAALAAVEECGADEELTKIVCHLADDRTQLCRLFGLRPEQANLTEWYWDRMETLWEMPLRPGRESQ